MERVDTHIDERPGLLIEEKGRIRTVARPRRRPAERLSASSAHNPEVTGSKQLADLCNLREQHDAGRTNEDETSLAREFLERFSARGTRRHRLFGVDMPARLEGRQGDRIVHVYWSEVDYGIDFAVNDIKVVSGPPSNSILFCDPSRPLGITATDDREHRLVPETVPFRKIVTLGYV